MLFKTKTGKRRHSEEETENIDEETQAICEETEINNKKVANDLYNVIFKVDEYFLIALCLISHNLLS